MMHFPAKKKKKKKKVSVLREQAKQRNRPSKRKRLEELLVHDIANEGSTSIVSQAETHRHNM